MSSNNKKVIEEFYDIDKSKIGRTLPLDAPNPKQVFEPVKQPAYNPEFMQNNVESDVHYPPLSEEHFPQTPTNPYEDVPTLRKRRKEENKTPSDQIQEESKQKSESSTFKYIAIIVVLISAIYVLYSTFAVQTAFVEVVDATWRREIYPQEYRVISESDWSLPPGAKLISVTNEIYRYDKRVIQIERKCRNEKVKIPTHKEYSHTKTSVLDDGTIEKEDVYDTKYKTEVKTICEDHPVYESIPEYRPKYHYEIMKWVDLNKIVTKGSAKGKWSVPYDPVFHEDKMRRISSRRSIYKIILRHNNKESQYKLSSLSEYERAKECVGKVAKVEWNYFSLSSFKC